MLISFNLNVDSTSDTTALRHAFSVSKNLSSWGQVPAYGADAPQVLVTLGTDRVDETLSSHVPVKDRAQAGHRVSSHNDGLIMKVQVRPLIDFQPAGTQHN